MARRLLGEVLAPMAGVAVFSALLSGAIALAVMDRLYGDSTAEHMEAAAAALATTLPLDKLGDPALAGPDAAAMADIRGRELSSWAARAAAASSWRVTLMAPDGRVLADSSADPALMENHAGRPEMATALAGGRASDRRRSATLGRELFYAAVPVYGAERGGTSAPAPIAVLRVAAELPAVEAKLAPSRWTLGVAAALVSAAAAMAAILFSRRVSRPLQDLAAASRALAAGELSRAVPGEKGPEELRDLARALSSMSTELARRVREAEAEGRERSAILDGMEEAVLALDPDCRVKLANPAARTLFDIPADAEPGRPLLEIARSAELESAAEDCLSRGASLEAELAIYGNAPGGGEGRRERWFQAFVAPLADGGAVIVLNDITRLRRLERVRRDFVANVSHELRTPIHLIKGFAEALAEGALDDPAKARRFLDIVRGNASRMESLIDDLLTLARLEQEGTDWLQCEVHPLEGLLEEAVEAVLPKAEEKGIAVSTACEPGLEARVNAGLIVQAVINLVDNAVKYSPPGSSVEVGAGRGGDGILVTVADHGIGIPARDLPRVFERFYRVDKARSRELGGTGLGLAIVRHIALAHGGSVAVESKAGEGTRFSIRLPIEGLAGRAT